MLNLKENYLMSHLNDLKDEFPDKIKEVRGKGLLTAFEMHDDPKLDGHGVSVGLLNQGFMLKKPIALLLDWLQH